MQANWTIKSLYYGKITLPKGVLTAGLDNDITIAIPYMGFLLQNGKENILVDCGIHEDNIVDGKAWGGMPAEGGTQYVIDALAKEGLTPKDIDAVMYTHLHNDHAGAAAFFPDARTYYQKDEYANLLNQLPSQKIRSDYDKRTPADMLKLKNLYPIDGDVKLSNGIEIYKIAAHTSGSMIIVVPTKEGRYIITGDLPHLNHCLFPKMNKMQLLDGSYIDITPAPDVMMPFLVNSVIYDHFAAFDGFYKMKALADEFDPKYFLTGHDPWIILKHTFG
ncbi:MAG TPA: N-acyl homoserine lactonase family protein [Anaerovoracaceae bacterium]|nr:N-acyl homoserine lactonase family protein [Anaerovoracaceae bacterium]